VLADHAFEGGRLFEVGLEAADQGLLREVFEDYWRIHVATTSPQLARFIRAESSLRSPEELLRELKSFVGMTGLDIQPDTLSGDLDELAITTAVAERDAAFEAARRSWNECRPAYRDFEAGAAIDGSLVERAGSCVLKGNVFQEKHRPGYLRSVDKAFADAAVASHPLPDLRIIDRAKLEQSIKSGTLPPLEIFVRHAALATADSQLATNLREYELHLRRRLLPWAAEEVRRRREQRGVQSYDDLLQHLLDALEGPSGERLATRLRNRYPAALIDEFQDTDPVQFRIFDRIYPTGEEGGTLFFVGDPKQAIYGFRRADVFAYIAARKSAARRYSLGVNRRSTKRLVDGVNALFVEPAPFVIADIAADPVEAIGDEERGVLKTPGDESPPLRFSFFAKCSVEQATRSSVRETVRQIVGLLQGPSAAFIEGGLDPGPIRGGSIAVLVRTNHQARRIRKALGEAGVPSVLAVQSSVFGTDVAADLELVLDAVRDPSDERKMGAAFATSLCGLSGEEVDLARREPGSAAADAWVDRVERFRGYHRRWSTRGFVEMFRDLVEGEGMAPRVLAAPDGERRLTDLLHLGECLGSEAAGGKRRIEALMNWFASSRADARDEAPADDDERRMRLESDEDLVQIATLHKSKGLEYDVVFLPFAWDYKLKAGDPPKGKHRKKTQDSPVLFHDAEAGEFAAGLDFGGKAREFHRQLARMEERAEFLRLFYVGVTRARHRCHVTWGAVKGNEASAPAWLIHRPRLGADVAGPAIAADDTPRARTIAELERLDRIDKALDTRNDEQLWEDLLALQARASDSIHVERVPPATGDPLPRLETTKAPATTLSPRTWTASHTPTPGRILSFSAIANRKGIGASSAQIAQAAELSENPDHDGESETTEEGAPVADDLSKLPSGRLAGKCLHDIFERLPFEALDPEAADEALVRAVANESLEAFDIRDSEARVDVVTETVRRTVCARLERGWRHPEPANADGPSPATPIRLAGLPVARRVRELEFHFPLQSVDGKAFAAAIRKDPACAELSPVLDASLEGYLKGYVDLVFQGDDGRFYVVDYKSNRLGDGPSAYGRDAVIADMEKHRYPLQSLIYTLALHRLLRQRLGDAYDPATHLGGSFYLYLRAIDRVRNDPGAGIVWLRHDLSALRALEAAVEARRKKDQA
jgi:exodeoxyribonuclease V beta subunit